jgi:hypothetical protein
MWGPMGPGRKIPLVEHGVGRGSKRYLSEGEARENLELSQMLPQLEWHQGRHVSPPSSPRLLPCPLTPTLKLFGRAPPTIALSTFSAVKSRAVSCYPGPRTFRHRLNDCPANGLKDSTATVAMGQ